MPQPARDLLLAPDGGPVITGGQIVIGPSSAQHLDLVTRSRPGDWRFWPLLGADLGSLVLDDGQEGISAKIGEISRQLEQDGAQNVDVSYNSQAKRFSIQGDYYV